MRASSVMSDMEEGRPVMACACSDSYDGLWSTLPEPRAISHEPRESRGLGVDVDSCTVRLSLLVIIYVLLLIIDVWTCPEILILIYIHHQRDTSHSLKQNSCRDQSSQYSCQQGAGWNYLSPQYCAAYLDIIQSAITVYCLASLATSFALALKTPLHQPARWTGFESGA